MEHTVTASRAARHLSDLLNQVQDKSSSFVITRNGKEVARLTSAPRRPKASLRRLVEELLAKRTGDPGFADDLERIQAEQPTLDDDPWAS
jgi:prevent-host-death family protein